MTRAHKKATTGPAQLALDFAQPANPAATPVPKVRAVPPVVLPSDPAERGYHSFTSEQTAALQALEQQFGLILNQRVRVTLFGVPAEFVGKLMLAQLLPFTSGDGHVRLRIGAAEFDDTDIESCVRLPH